MWVVVIDLLKRKHFSSGLSLQNQSESDIFFASVAKDVFRNIHCSTEESIFERTVAPSSLNWPFCPPSGAFSGNFLCIIVISADSFDWTSVWDSPVLIFSGDNGIKECQGSTDLEELLGLAFKMTLGNSLWLQIGNERFVGPVDIAGRANICLHAPLPRSFAYGQTSLSHCRIFFHWS